MIFFYLFESQFNDKNTLKPYLINQNFNNQTYTLNNDNLKLDDFSDIDEVISYASNFFIKERFKDSPSFAKTYRLVDSMMITLDLNYSDFNKKVGSIRNNLIYI